MARSNPSNLHTGTKPHGLVPVFLSAHLSAPARSVARTLRSVWFSLLHPLRRRRAVMRLLADGDPRSFLFVCLGNICRSPYAERAFERRLRAMGWQDNLRVRSAGLIGPDRSSPPNAIEAARRRGVDLTPHRSRLVSSESVAEFDVIFVMESDQKRVLKREFSVDSGDVVVLGDLDRVGWLDHRTIRDPIESPLHVFEQTYARIDRCLEAIITSLSRTG